MSWREHAYCVGADPDTFFPVKSEGQSVLAAKRMCARCSVASACLEYALSNGETLGVWGGLSAQERQRLGRTATVDVTCFECRERFVVRAGEVNRRVFCSRRCCSAATSRRHARYRERQRGAA